MSYKVKEKIKGGTFSIPDVIADKHLRFASGDQIKVLIVALRHPEKSCDAHSISKYLKMTEADAEDCLQYWVLMGILTDQSSEEDAAEALPPQPVKFIPGKIAGDPVKPPVKSAPKTDISDYTRPSAAEIATRMEESPEISALFRELQMRLGKTIGYDGQCTFISLYDRYGLPADVIYMLVDHCVSMGKTGYSYIEKTGKSWAEQEIDTIEKAAEKIASLDKAGKFWKKFAAAQGLTNSKPTSNQTKYITRWLDELKMSFDMICLAYEEMTERTGKISYPYMDKILLNWHECGYKTPEDVETASKNRSDAAKAVKQDKTASYDLSSVKNSELNGSLKYERKSKK